MTKSTVIQVRKNAAVHFLQLVVSGKIDEAYQLYVDKQGKHHNVFFPAGFPALQKAMAENHIQFPDKQITVINVLGDGDLVAVHSQLVLSPGNKERMIVVHVFRFLGEKIIEFWDCGQSVPDSSPNKDGAL